MGVWVAILYFRVLKIWSATDRIFSRFGPFYVLPSKQPRKSTFWKNEKHAWRYYHFTQVYHKWQSYDLWFLRCEAQQTKFFVIWAIFCPFTPVTAWKIKILKKWNERLEILSFYTSVSKIRIMLYCSWDMARDKCNCYFSVWTFCPFTP